jgi:hypothetical protein
MRETISISGGSPLLQQGELDFQSSGKKSSISKMGFSPGISPALIRSSRA